MKPDTPGEDVFGRLRQFVKRRQSVERCDMCGAPLATEHDHLLDPEARKLVCACTACAVLFSGQANLKYRRVPRRVRRLEDFHLTGRQWEDLRLPIDLAFIYRSSTQDRMVASYPSPAGATESLLSLEAWEEIATGNPVLREMEDDVEALLINRVGQASGREPEYYLVPADQCYRLVGLIRLHWKGLSGGPTVWGEIATFFGELQEMASPTAGRQHA